jgi:two-component system, LytTR family, sensor histidine kinase AlgZ
MLRIGRVWIFSLLWTNLSVLLVVLVQIAGNGTRGPRDLLRMAAYSMVYANVTALPAILILPGWLGRYSGPRRRQVLVVVLGSLSFAAVGCLTAQALLMWTRVAIPQHFWTDYLHKLWTAVILALVFALGAFFYASLRDRLQEAERKLHEKEIAAERARKLVAEARLQSLESRLHPHFLFNTLNSISSLIPTDPAKAEQTVGRLASLLRSSLDNTTQPVIPQARELAVTKDYVEIERVRFGGKLRGRVEVPEELHDIKVPPLSIQSLVENAVKHGITPQRTGGEFAITASLANARLCIEVCDTGPGFDVAAIRAGHGLDNLVGRLDALYGDAARLNVLRRDGWCVVQMILPYS